MSSRERDEIFNSIHGVQIGSNEEPQAVQRAIMELQKRLSEMRTSSIAFMLAESINYSFVHNRNEYLEFLRISNFDPAKAAVRMIKYYEFRRDFFGESVLCKKPSLDELTSEEVKILRKGSFQWYVRSCRISLNVLFYARIYCTDKVCWRMFVHLIPYPKASRTR